MVVITPPLSLLSFVSSCRVGWVSSAPGLIVPRWVPSLSLTLHHTIIAFAPSPVSLTQPRDLLFEFAGMAISTN